MEQLQCATLIMSSGGMRTWYLMAPQWQLASYPTLAGVSEFDMAWEVYCGLGNSRKMLLGWQIG